MGQQQLLIIILVTIIIGSASVVAITTFDSAAKIANRDAIVNDLNALASEAQEYFIRPEPLGGGWRTFIGFSISGKLMPAEGINESGDLAQTQNGTVEILSVSACSVILLLTRQAVKDICQDPSMKRGCRPIPEPAGRMIRSRLR